MKMAETTAAAKAQPEPAGTIQAADTRAPALSAADVRAAFERREEATRLLAADVEQIVAGARRLAERFRSGATLYAFGNGSDAGHVAVEFMHPVIVGKPALPALAPGNDAPTVNGVGARAGLAEPFAHQLRHLGRPGDVVLGITPDGRCENVRRALDVARDLGMFTLVLSGGDPADAPGADLSVTIRSSDALVVKELHVAVYHLLWELVHVFLEQLPQREPEPDGLPAGVRELYPFLSGAEGPAARGDDPLDSTRRKLSEISTLRYEVLDRCAPRLAACASAMAQRFSAGGRLFAFGNGGSSTDAQDLATAFLHPPPAPGGDRRALPALALTSDVAVVTALANDVGFEVVFSRQLAALARPGDIAVGLSTSGGSANIVRALGEAARGGLLTAGLAGHDGGRLAALDELEHLFVMPSSSVHRIQEAQTTVYHVLYELTRQALRGTRP